MPAERRPGMDHTHYAWSPLPTRGVLRWPFQARVALCALVTLEHLEWEPPAGHFEAQNLAGGLGRLPAPDYVRLTHREYGHRVGIFRLLDVLEKHGIPPTVAMDALTARHYPYLVRHCLERGCEIIGHGLSVSRMITSRMTAEEERDYIRETIDVLLEATGNAPVGWFGPEYGESERTPQLLAEAGIRYVCDWTNDEQPYRLQVPRGELYALPIALELDDTHALWSRRMPIDRYGQLLTESCDGLYEDGAHNGRLMVLNLHPWLIGQPFRIGTLDAALGAIVRRQGVWAAHGRDLVDWFQKHAPEGAERDG